MGICRRTSCQPYLDRNLGAHFKVNMNTIWDTLNMAHPYCRYPPPSDYAVDLPNLYKRSIVFFRSLHSFVRLLPTYDLYRKIRKLNEANPLSIGYRLSSNPKAQYNSEISLGKSMSSLSFLVPFFY